MRFTQPIAIVGIGGIFPGAADLDAFWKNIKEGACSSREAPPGRWVLSAEDAYSSAGVQPDRVSSRRACFLDDLPVSEQSELDPLYHVTLAAGVQAFESAVTKGLDRKRTGVIIGNIALPTQKSSALSWEILGRTFEEKVLGGKSASGPEGVDPLNRYVTALPAGLLAKKLDLGGGTYTLDAACASSLYAVKLACDELLSGRADAMLSGGVSMADSLYTQMGFSQLTAISPDGVCSPFDAKANGLVVGEGAGIFVLKRLEDALAAGDHIYALIRGVGLSNDRAGKLLAPSSEGQMRAMQTAYEQTGWSPQDIDMIECHGTGTLVGDAVEVKGMKELWGAKGWKEGQCVIGSVKSNVGHLLTGAGAAGLMKVLLALENSTLPPTANFSASPPDMALANSPFRVLDQPEPWEKKDKKTSRKAAVSGFGFGGINAHVLLEEWDPPKKTARKKSASKNIDCPIAIVGMEAHFGPWDSLSAFEERVVRGKNGLEPGPKKNWFGVEESFWAREKWPQGIPYKGYGIDEISVPLGKYRIPPNEFEEMLSQQVLMLKVAGEALASAGCEKKDHINSGCFIGLGFDLGATNFHLRWAILNKVRSWARELSLDLSENEIEEWARSLRDAFGPALTPNATTGNLGSIVASRIAREFQFGGPSYTISSEESSGISALNAAVRGLQQKEIDLALAGAVDLAGDIRALITTPHAEDVPFGEGAGAVVLKRLEDAQKDGDTIYAVIKEISNGETQETIPDARADIGHAGAASAVASLIKAALCLHHEVLPDKKEYWLRDRAKGPRRAAINSSSIDGNHFHVVLEEYGGKKDIKSAFPVEEAVFAVSGNDVPALLKGLEDLRVLADRSEDNISSLAQRWQQERPAEEKDAKAVAIVSGDRHKLLKQIDQAARSLRETPEKSLDGNERSLYPDLNPDRIFYSANPLGQKGKIAFVFPGSGNNYPGMGQQIGLAWPEVLRQQDAENEYLRSQIMPEHFWSCASLDHIKDDLRAHIFGHVTFGTIMSDVLQGFGLRPQAVISYSLGESTSLLSMRAWNARDFMMKRMGDSPLFTTDLAGPYNAVKKAWKLSKNSKVDWSVGVVDVPAAKVKKALKKHEKAYLLIVNTPDECVVGGDREAVSKLVDDLGCNFLAVEQATIAHCAAVKAVAKPYRDIHLFEVSPPEGIDFYSGSWGRKYELTRDSAADAILAHATEGIDFPKTIHAAYEDGARVFIEIGPGNSCSRMIRKILGQRPHFARSASVPSQGEVSPVVCLVAALVAERVPIDLSKLCREELSSPKRSSKSLKLPVGGAPFQVPIPKRREPEPALVSVSAPDAFVKQFENAQTASVAAHDAYLRLSQQITQSIAQNLQFQIDLIQSMGGVSFKPEELEIMTQAPQEGPCALNREQCMEFAVGKIGNVLGPKYAEIDQYPTRVRLPDEPMMFVDRITEIEGEPLSLTSGRVVTEHDVLHNGWYLDGGRIPTCDAVEAGQADLFLSGYLGIDLKTKGRAVYRLLDATVTFHDHLPEPGDTIRYDIRILNFFTQGDTYLFRFEFDGTVDGKPALSMRKGCAGFFTQEELAAGRGVMLTELDKRPMPRSLPADWQELVSMQIESFSDDQIKALRSGSLAGCFGPLFEGLDIKKPYTIPGGKMKMIDRVQHLDPKGGRFGLGSILAEADIRPDDWFLTCHFSDDNVMPGTLMYECCMHALRIFLLRMGWVAEEGSAVWEPVPGVNSSLKCRGQVIASTRKAAYEIVIKELGYGPEPYAIADAYMYADGRMIVEMTNMSIRLTGANREQILSLWKNRKGKAVRQKDVKKTGKYENASILAFAIGKPSEAFGEPYKIFDKERVIARLPGPPYKVLDRITEVNAEPWKMVPGGTIEAQYDVPRDAWYFPSNRQGQMPFAVLLEVALQPCGWYSAYMGSALTSNIDLHYRNLGGSAVQYGPVTPDAGILTTRVKSTNVSSSGGMIIQHFEFEVSCKGRCVYKGATYFGFFSDEALADQIGIRDAKVYQPTQAEIARAKQLDFPDAPPFPDKMLKMIDHIDLYVADGGPHGLGYIRGSMKVDPSAWFFKAHFYQDPVIPGSLGLESMLQLMKYAAFEKWGAKEIITIVPGMKHDWVYRGQVIPKDKQVVVDAWITSIDDQNQVMFADGFLTVDGRVIYQMKDFSLRRWESNK